MAGVDKQYLSLVEMDLRTTVPCDDWSQQKSESHTRSHCRQEDLMLREAEIAIVMT